MSNRDPAKLIYRGAPFLGLVIGIWIATLITSVVDQPGIVVDVLQQLAIVTCLAASMVIARRDSTRSQDMAAAMHAFGLVVAIQLVSLFIVLIWIDSPFFQYVGYAVDAVFRSFGWYPAGADAWLPLALAIWIVTSGLVVLAAVGVVWAIRAFLRRS